MDEEESNDHQNGDADQERGCVHGEKQVRESQEQDNMMIPVAVACLNGDNSMRREDKTEKVWPGVVLTALSGTPSLSGCKYKSGWTSLTLLLPLMYRETLKAS